MDRIQDIRAFEELIFDVLEEYINNKESYSPSVVLQIDTHSMEVSISMPSLLDGLDNILIDSLTSIEDETITADCDAINKLANKYFFVR